MLVGFPYIEETVPHANRVICKTFVVYVIGHNPIVGRVKVKAQRFCQVIIYSVLPIEQEVTLVQSWQPNVAWKQICAVHQLKDLSRDASVSRESGN